VTGPDSRPDWWTTDHENAALAGVADGIAARNPTPDSTQPPPCAGHNVSVLYCPECGAKRAAHYERLAADVRQAGQSPADRLADAVRAYLSGDDPARRWTVRDLTDALAAYDTAQASTPIDATPPDITAAAKGLGVTAEDMYNAVKAGKTITIFGVVYVPAPPVRSVAIDLSKARMAPEDLDRMKAKLDALPDGHLTAKFLPASVDGPTSEEIAAHFAAGGTVTRDQAGRVTLGDNPYPYSQTFPDPCQEGCDSGSHLPGCPYGRPSVPPTTEPETPR
jgi:hypothetical protein